MNNAQLLSHVRSALKVTAGLLAAHGLQNQATFLNAPDVLASVLLIVSLLWSHFTHAGDASASPRLPKLSALAALGAAAFVFSGCTVGQSVPRLKLAVDPVTHSVTLDNPKDTTIKNFRAEVQTNGTSIVTFDSLTTVMNPDVITTTGDAQAKLITAAGAVAISAISAAKP